MNRDQWQEVKRVFAAALDGPPPDLDAFVADACGHDDEVRAEVRRLLASHFSAGDFLEGSALPLEVRSPDDEVPASEAPLIGVRFDVRAKLGQGSFGDVYDAFDREQGCRVALKYLRRFDPDQLYRLKREFRTLSDLHHPNLIHVFELFSSNAPPFFTMELLQGQDFGQHLRATAHLRRTDTDRWHAQLRGYLVQLGHALVTLHEAQLVHRDVKPSNIFITDSDRVVLLDFGLAKQLGAVTSASTFALAGTPDYAAPEQFETSSVGPAADWYAVGALLFEALTGRRAVEGSLRQVLARKQESIALRPSSVVPDVPADLDRLCEQLTQRDPGARPSGRDVLAMLEGTHRSAIKEEPRERPLARAFLGREAELACLESAFEDMRHGLTSCVHVHGASGTGKSALVRHFLEGVRGKVPECVVLQGRCYESESAPHRGLDELVDRLALFLDGVDPQRMQSLVPRYFGLLARLFPVLQRLPSTPRQAPDIVDPREQRQRALECLRECLCRIAESHLLVLWIDDLQWGDADAVRVLNELVRGSNQGACLIVLSYRDTDLASNPILSALARTPGGSADARLQMLALDNLSTARARELALNLLARESSDTHDLSALADTIARESRGNPFFLTELAHFAGTMPSGHGLGAGGVGIGHVIRTRAGLLPAHALRLLEIVTVAGQPLRSDVCATIDGASAHYFESRSVLVGARFLQVRQTAAGEQLDVYHDQIRDAIAGSLSAERTVAYHRLIAQALERVDGEDSEQLSVHYEAAGQIDQAIAAASRAARAATDTLAFDQAARLYQRVLGLMNAHAPERATVIERLGDALSNAGRGKEAATALLEASEHAEPSHRLDLRRRACEQYLRNGLTDEGIALMRSLLHEAGMWFPKTSTTVFCSLLWHRFWVRVLLPWYTSRRPTRPPTAHERIRLDVSATCAIGMGLIDALRGADFQARNALLAMRTADPMRRARGLAGELGLGGVGGRRSLSRTGRLFAEAMAAASESKNTWAVVFTTQMSGVASHTAGRFSESLEKNDVAAARYTEECSGVDWELTTAQSFSLGALYLMGRWREHAARLPGLIRSADARGDRYGTAALPLIAYAYIDHLVADKPAEAHAAIERALSEWRYHSFQAPQFAALQGHIETFLYTGDGPQAIEAIEQAWPTLTRSHVLRVRLRHVLLLSMRGRACLATAHAASPRVRQRLLRTARQDATRLERLRQPWTEALGHLLQAGIATYGPQGREVEAHLRRAEHLFVGAEMEQYAAAVRWRLWQCRPSLAAERSEALRWIDEQGISRPASVIDMLAPGLWLPG